MKVMKNILFWISVVCLLFTLIAVAVPRLFGAEFRTVLTGSMTPEIPVGSLVVIVPTKAEDIKIGDDISFVTQGEKVVTHRVIKINRETNQFTTWGIANDKSAIDAPNKYENILGVVRLHIPFVGRIFSWFATLQGKIIAVTMIVAAFILSTIFGLWSKNKKDENTKNDDSSQKNQRFDALLDSFVQSDALFREETQSDNFEVSARSDELFKNDPLFKDLFKEN